MSRNILEEAERSGFCFEGLAALYPGLQLMKQVQQNPEYHREGDVYVHTKLVCSRLTKLPEWDDLSFREQKTLFLAAAFHDIGKTICTKQENGVWISPKHTIIGEKEFRRMAYREREMFGLSFQERELIAKLIRFHGLPVWFWEKRRPEFDLLKAAESVPLRLLYLLSKADVQGRSGRDQDRLLEHVELFADCAREQGIWEKPYGFVNTYTRYQYFHKEDLWQGASLYDPADFEVILMSGLPLAGKDTWIERYGNGRKVISLDDVRAEFGISPAEGSARAADIAVRRARELLRRKEPFIWNATNSIRETRRRLISLFTSYGASVCIVYLEVPYEEIIRRNGIRKRHIPETVLEGMIRRLEVPEAWEAYELDASGVWP